MKVNPLPLSSQAVVHQIYTAILGIKFSRRIPLDGRLIYCL